MGKIQDREHLAAVVAANKSTNQVAKVLGYKPVKNGKMAGGVHKFLKQKFVDWGIDTSHFVGLGWNKGLKRQTDSSVERYAVANELSDDEVFCERSRASNRTTFNRLIRRGKVEVCDGEGCGLSTWLGKKIRLHLEHCNGVNDDNRKENLKFLCPNCHSQTITYSVGCRKLKKLM